MIRCSRETPWGIHDSLREDHCPRCGFIAPRPFEETSWWRSHGPSALYLLEYRRQMLPA
jgi:hypothetical protein